AVEVELPEFIHGGCLTVGGGTLIPADCIVAIAFLGGVPSEFKLSLRLVLIFVDSGTLVEGAGKVDLRFRIPVCCSLTVPFCCFRGINRNTKSAFVHKCKIPLCSRIAVLGGFGFPYQRFRVVGRYAAPVEVNPANLILSVRITLARGFRQQADGFFSVWLHMKAKVVAGRQCCLRRRVVRRRLLLRLGKGSIVAWAHVRLGLLSVCRP